jgi:hypothetical protein
MALFLFLSKRICQQYVRSLLLSTKVLIIESAWQPFTENKSQKKRQLESAAPIKSFIVTALLAYRLCLSLSTGYGTFRRTYIVV